MTALARRPLGLSSLQVSVVGLGANNFGPRIDVTATDAVVGAAIDAGINLIDTADIYGESEAHLGQVLGARRDQVVLATKFGAYVRDGRMGPDDGHRGHPTYVRRAVEASLARLRTDRIDLYQLHVPDPDTPIAETLGVLDELVTEGKVLAVGCSNLAAWQITDAAWEARTAGTVSFCSTQAEYSLLARSVEDELLPALAHHDMALLPYFPLASGLLTGKYHRGQPAPADSRYARWGWQDRLTDDRFDVVEALDAFAQERDLTLLTVAIGWLAAQPTVASVIAGATSPEQVQANAAAASWIPTADDLSAIDAITRRRS